ncbi:histidine phosphatase family protein [archaeon]|jgi:broad specificity phosphatase PhoE|nr:histidine phosphatase family protein [archaeon]MBT3577410.1 histidine phosphatase family protein [archaeon]MBT6820347.1 histidine phosphatase family protein [archaeon]MBT6956102.1 histidine phosphatase family protein [archaeon]MBT7025161.1 histidine phosphatase family protein [archaeon]
MKLIITRHGETEENRRGIIQGHLPGTLSELGRGQAEKLAERLKRKRIDLIISSDLARALDTARIVAKFHQDIDFILDKRLRERFLGEFQGKTKEEFGIQKTESIADHISGGNAEDNKSFFSRAGSLIKETMKRFEENILLVGHNGIGKAIIGNLLCKKAEELSEIKKLGNTSVTIFEERDRIMNLKLLNCTKHLE